jgi:general secretion pathway protein D
MRCHALASAFLCCALQTGVAAQDAIAPAAEPPSAEGPRITLNMRNAEIGSVLEWLAQTSGRRVVVDPRVRGPVTILARDPMSRDEAFRVVVAALGVYGYTAIDQGEVLQVLPAANVRTGATRFLDSIEDPAADLPVNEVIRLGFLPAEQVANTLKPMMPPHAGIVALPGQNALLVTDVASGVRRIARIARELDMSGSLEMDVVPLAHAGAAEVVDTLGKLLGEKDGNGLQLVADERVNAVLMAGSEAMRARAKDLVARLDQPVIEDGSIEVIYLHYLKASELLPVLKGIVEKGDKESGAARVSIEASESTNALVINAPPDQLNDMREVVRRLDIRRAQVLVEAIIAEVDEDMAQELGVEWRTAFNGDGTEAVSRFANGAVQVTDAPLGAVGRGLTVGYFRNGSLRALLKALETTGDSNILSTPSVVTLDNQEAEILVGSSVPFKTGEAASGSSPVSNPFTTIERQDIGVTLKVKPQINQGDAITLDILQSVETLTDSEVAEDVITDKRKLQTSVMLQDQDIVVLGGLIQNQRTRTAQKVPLLGDIPLIGTLFRSTTDKLERRNLMVFLRTRVLTDLEAAEQETRDRYDRIRGLQEAFDRPAGARATPDSTPQLPEFPAGQLRP